MSNERTKPGNNTDNNDAAIKPEPETLHKTDPQDNMEGPVSSLVQGVKEKVEENDNVSREEADEERDSNK